ncbi:hypothetical protein [Enterobacter mori]|uniref:hypothetical protein n=1 Tax=Enterobacter mori TaxID=539813 RepID=UPI003B840F24
MDYSNPSAVGTTAMLDSTTPDFITFGVSYPGLSLSYTDIDDNSDASVLWGTYSPLPPGAGMALADNSNGISARGTLMR